MVKTKKQIKQMCKEAFEWGKNNVADYLFDKYFEEIWGEKKQ